MIENMSIASTIFGCFEYGPPVSQISSKIIKFRAKAVANEHCSAITE